MPNIFNQPTEDHPFPWKVVDANGNEVPGVWDEVYKVLKHSALQDPVLRGQVQRLYRMVCDKSGVELAVYD